VSTRHSNSRSDTTTTAWKRTRQACLESVEQRLPRRQHPLSRRQSSEECDSVEVKEERLTDGRIPLNDDRQEKAKRLQSRQAFHNAQMDSIKAAASPVRKRKSFGPNGEAPSTPQQDGQDGMYVGGSAVTPMKRVPILANFEEWMKMATDNVRLESLE